MLRSCFDISELFEGDLRGNFFLFDLGREFSDGRIDEEGFD